jgi:hypothetical protein
MNLGSVSNYLTPPWNAKAQPSLDGDSASYGLASAKAANRYRFALRPLLPLRSIVTCYGWRDWIP